MTNQSTPSEIVLVGFPSLPVRFYLPVSLIMFLVYISSLSANGTVILLIILKESLHKPMYMAIANLAASDLLFDTITLPKIIAKYWFEDGAMPFSACLFQVFWVHFLGTLDAFILMVMAMDRYVAISRPLHYSTIISNKQMVVACTLCLFVSSIAGLIGVFVILTLVLNCGRTRINSYFCSSSSVYGLACGDVTYSRLVTFCTATVVLLLPLSFIVFSYVAIIRILNSSINLRNGEKAFYTCTTHLLVITIYYIPRLFVYITNQTKLILNADVNVLILCLYTFLPHMANPIIYCLRTNEIRQIIKQCYQHLFYLKGEEEFQAYPYKGCKSGFSHICYIN
ncbi:olfactory receptor 6B1-like [Hyla sarda]|uniref:olfactory receptor 6B1-like n=1 Tax=Hyla sarda TaxID=327740 RepID=UPI0024C2D37D|nr:olfactory receptor 6B1-like [Hyla sarda]